MNILVLSPFIPFPLDQGGKIRTFNIITQLSRSHAITLATLTDDLCTSDTGPLSTCCEEIVIVERPARLWPDRIAFFTSGRPYNAIRYHSAELRRRLAELARRKQFDLVLVEFSMMWQYTDLFPGVQVVLDAHNVEADIVAQIGSAATSPLWRCAYRIEEARLRRLEDSAWKEANLILAVSNDERTVIVAASSSDKVVTVANGVDLERYSFVPVEERGDNILFLGGLGYLPNLDAARYLLEDIRPELRRMLPDAPIDMVGRSLELLGAEPPEGVIWHDGAADVLPWFRSSGLLAVPLRMGAGTRLKVLEAMASGLPMVSTAKGCEGIGVRDGEHLLIAESPHDFAAAVARLMADRELRRRLAQAARAMVEERYGWEGIVAAVEKELGKMVPGELEK